jgi:hypothetical protein
MTVCCHSNAKNEFVLAIAGDQIIMVPDFRHRIISRAKYDNYFCDLISEVLPG